MLSKLFSFFKPGPLRIEITNAKTISISPNDFLVITVDPDISQALLQQLRRQCREFFKTQNVLVLAGDDIGFLKIAIQEKLVDDIMLKEELTKWKN